MIVWEAGGDIWWVNWFSEQSRWSKPALVNQVNSHLDKYPRISIASDGTTWVVWKQNVAGTWSTLSTRYIDGAWTSPDTVVAGSSGSDGYNVLALTRDDAWVVSDGRTPATGSQTVILVRHYEAGEWVEYGTLTAKLAPSHSDDLADVAVDSDGMLWVAWTHSTSSTVTPYVARRPRGGAWTLPEAMPLGGGRPVPIALESSQVLVVWTAYEDPHDYDVAYRFWNDGQWGPVGFVSEPDGTDDIDGLAAAAVDPAARVPVVAWVAGPYFSPDIRDIKFSLWTGSSWTPEEVISNPDSTGFAIDDLPRITLDQGGVAWVCWMRLGPWPQNPDQDIWFNQATVYPPPAALEGQSPSTTAAGRILRVTPNPTSGTATIDLWVARSGEYEAVIVDVGGRLIDQFSLGWLGAGMHVGAEAFRWPSSSSVQPISGVYIVSVRETQSRAVVASGKLILLR
jgi:hypothetical protein